MIRYTSKVSEKGQIVIPVDIQRQMGIHDGEVLEMQSGESEMLIEQVPNWAEQTRGSLSSSHAQIEPEQLEALIEATALIESFQNVDNPKW